MADTADRYDGPKKRAERAAAAAATLAELQAAKILRLRATASLDFPLILAGASADLTVTVTGAVIADSAQLHHAAAPAAGLSYVAWVSAADTVTVRAFNRGSVATDPAAQEFRVTVWKA